jgi:hypothetical protein
MKENWLIFFQDLIYNKKENFYSSFSFFKNKKKNEEKKNFHKNKRENILRKINIQKIKIIIKGQ